MIVQNNRGKITIDELIARGLILPEDGAVLRAEAFKNRFRKIDGVVGFFTVRRGQQPKTWDDTCYLTWTMITRLMLLYGIKYGG